VPLIADEKYDKLITKPITDQNKIDYSVINKEITRYEGMDLYSRYYQPFSCKEDGNVFYNLNTQSTSYCNGMDSATSIIFGYQNNEDVYYSEG
jgi:predicted secreted protein